jgi:hypothetical protein
VSDTPTHNHRNSPSDLTEHVPQYSSAHTLTGPFTYPQGQMLGDLNTESQSHDFVTTIRSVNPAFIFKYSSSLCQLCFYSSSNIPMKVLFQLSSTPSCPTYSPSIMAIFRREHNNICILFWNARRISNNNNNNNKKAEFFNYLEANNIAIALVNETHLHHSVKFKWPNYYKYR